MHIGHDRGHDVRRAQMEHRGDVGLNQYTEDVFWYSMNFGSLAPGASSVQTLQIAADEPFKITKLTGIGWLNGVAPIVRNTSELTVIVQDGSSGRYLTYQPVPFDTIVGTAQLPYILPIPRIFKSRGIISATVTNTSTAGGTNNTYNGIEMTFGGTKLFRDDDDAHLHSHGHRR